ncbi:hypothetical protein ISF_07361 [Cordyceps fumosorosea ARSEF 2679]|uniref:Integral membrane protein n=1 Tax=Cordyceps fumosorosea (strain ARSEF 2679) TaxID=1081104 RepID=A0A162IGJ3_CORFA|nr:hypothetical protein ISF_07361 [Cordyceps fumosorosea ARSEF 2679]OAA56845.1 hypothetical protein ISF_07361 [Cordyceps fumosorosea ARSEF 2679]
MFPPAASSSPLRLLSAFVVLLCLAPLVAGQWVRDAWIRKHRCDGHPWTNVTFGVTPFWVDSLRGHLDSRDDGSARLSLSMLAVHDTSMFGCDDIDLAALERSLRLQVLGKDVAQVVRFNSTCPLPITPSLTPIEGFRFSAFHVDYQLEHAHRLQTLAAEYQFRTTRGSGGRTLDCAAVKITPYIGTSSAVALALVPAGVMAVVGAASWQTYAAAAIGGVDRYVDFSSALVSHQGPVWDTIMDAGVYLRYLQFAFLSSSLSIEYPGFLPPIASNLAWSSLMFWRGPYDGGLTWPGVEQGMYVSNATFGMDYMVRMLGFPRIMDFMFDAFLNLAILVAALLAILCAVHMLASRLNPQNSASSFRTRKLGYMSVEVCLSLFSMPLLAYMSNDLMLLGYLPHYRVTLIALTMLVLLYVHFLITRPFLRPKSPTKLPSGSLRNSRHTSGIRGALQSLSFYIPHFMPLLQALAVGALQDWGYVQTIVLFVAEVAILVHTAVSKYATFRFSRYETALLCACRLMTVSLLIATALLTEEAAKQWMGYVIICLHGIVIFPGFLGPSIWRLYHVFRTGRYGNGLSPAGHSDGRPNAQSVNLDDLNAHRPFTTRNTPSTTRDHRHVSQTRDFYRKPRARPSTPDIRHGSTSPSQSSSSGECRISPSPSPSQESESEQALVPPQLSVQPPLHGLDVLSEIRPQVDYSFREADLFYGMPVNDMSTNGVADPAVAAGDTSYRPTMKTEADEGTASGKKTPSWRSAVHTTWAKMSALTQPKPKEEGFQVVRPGNAALRMARMQQAQVQAERRGQTPAQSSCASSPEVQ